MTGNMPAKLKKQWCSDWMAWVDDDLDFSKVLVDFSLWGSNAYFLNIILLF